MLAGDSWHEMARSFAARRGGGAALGHHCNRLRCARLRMAGCNCGHLSAAVWVLTLAGRTLLLLTATGGRRQRQDRRLILGVFENMLGVELRSVLQRTNPALSRLDSGWVVTDVGIPYPDAAETSYRRHSRVFAKSPHKERWSNIILTAIDKKRGY